MIRNGAEPDAQTQTSERAEGFFLLCGQCQAAILDQHARAGKRAQVQRLRIGQTMQLMAMLLQLRGQRGQGQALANQDNLKTFHRNDPWLAIEPGR